MFRTFKIAATIAITALLLAGLAACTTDPTPRLSIQDPWARPAAMGVGTAAIYFTLVNEGNASDALVDVSSDAAESARFHETQMEGNIISMVPVTRIEIPAKGLTELKPGGLHVMLMGLKQDLNNGDTVSVTLRFEKSDEVVVEAEVLAP
ncbi:MAG: hypothetical protein CL873_02370 [Dehalococcoidales bacterium]|nr:hypothetical protein [Dehalococcoidales bacterium]